MNLENLNLLIDTIQNAKPAQCRMGTWKMRLMDNSGEGCGTAYCVAGWADHLVLEHAIDIGPVTSDELDVHFYTEVLAKFLGITTDEANQISIMAGSGYTPTQFDRMPAPRRKAAMLKLLTNLRDGYGISWNRAIDETAGVQ